MTIAESQFATIVYIVEGQVDMGKIVLLCAMLAILCSATAAEIRKGRIKQVENRADNWADCPYMWMMYSSGGSPATLGGASVWITTLLSVGAFVFQRVNYDTIAIGE